MSRPLVYAVIAVVTLSLVFWRLDVTHQAQFRANSNLKVLHQLSLVRAKLESSLSNKIYMMSHLASYVSLYPNIGVEEFRRVAKELADGVSGVRSIQLAKGGIVSHVFPLAGNEKALGFNILGHPQQRHAALRALHSRETVIAGPVDLIQGGNAFISRTPVFLTPHGDPLGSGEFWGFATLLLTRNALLQEADIINSTMLLNFAIRGKDGLGESGEVFWGDGAIFQNSPIVLDVQIPNGAWQIAAEPFGGWDQLAPNTWLNRVFSFLFVISAGVLVYLVLSNRHRLALEVIERKRVERHLEQEKNKLEEAIQEITTLSGLIPICAECKKIRDDEGYWEQIESYVSRHSDAVFTHSMCPECVREYYPELNLKNGPGEEA